jgi:hypothetical protein
MKALAPVLLALAALHAVAAPGSPACGKALEALRELEDRVLAAPRERADALRRQMLQVRRNAALVCLGESGDETTSRPPRVEAPPPSRGAAPAALAPLRLPNPAPPARVAPPDTPRALSTCDANGCWTSDGVRLQRVGPQLLGPSGFCTTAGHTVQCP